MDERADLFSLGRVLYRLCAGEAPFKGETMMGTLMAIVLNDPIALTQQNDKVPPELSELIMRLLAKDPSRRPSSAREVITQLAEIERNMMSGTARSSGVVSENTHATSPQGSRLVTTKRDDSSTEDRIRNPRVLRLVGLLLAIVIRAKDLSPVANSPIEWLTIVGTPIEDLTPLLTMPLQHLEIDNPRQHTELLRKISTLTTINDKPVAEVLADIPESSNADRRVAEWVLSIGGSIQLNDADSNAKTVAELPKEPFRLTEIKLRRNTNVTDDGMALLKGVKALRRLKMDNTAVSNAGLAHLKDLHELEWLDISNTRVTDDGLAHIKNIKQLTTLFLDTTSVTDAGLANIKDIQGLTWLVLALTKVSDQGLVHVGSLEKLHTLSLYGTSVTDDGLIHLNGLKELKTLDLSHTALTNKGLGHLQSLTELKTLHLQAPNVTDEGLARLQVLKNLEFLDLAGTKVTAKGLAEFHAAVPGCKVKHDGGVLEPAR